MIIKTVADFRKYVPINAAFQMHAINPQIIRAERDVLQQYIGEELYLALDAACNSEGTMPAPLATLLPFAQAVVANQALITFIPIGSIQISDKGIVVQSEDTVKPAPLWAKEELQNALTNALFFELEALRLFLDENKENYPQYTSSTAFERSKELFIQTVDEFNDVYNIGNSHRTFVRLKSVLRNVQNEQIRDVLGEAYYLELLEKFIDEDLNPDDKNVLRELRKSLVFFTISEACRLMPVQIIDGVLVVRSDMISMQGKGASANDVHVNRLMTSSYKKAEEYLLKFKGYLNSIASASVIPTYFNSSEYIKPGTEYQRSDNADDNKLFNMFT